MMLNYEAIMDSGEWTRYHRAGFIPAAMMDIWSDMQQIDAVVTPADLCFEARLDSWVDTIRDIRGLPE